MKIDLHCHTKKIKTGDADTRNVTPELFKEKTENADVKVVAITNHNHFDLEQYNILKTTVKESCLVWPGIELDVMGISKKRGHLIVIANPEIAEEFSHVVTKLLSGKDIERVCFELKTIYDATCTLDVIYIFHFHKKPCVDEDDIAELRMLVKDDSRIFNETPDSRSLGVFANYGYNVMIGSDVSDWHHYEECTFAELRLPISSFGQFCKLAQRDETVITTLLNERRSYQLIAHPHESINLPIMLFGDINIIFGQKGTGKSEILKSLYEDLSRQGLSCQLYIGNDRENAFSDYLKTTDMERSSQKVSSNECSEEFSYLFSCTDKNPTLLSDYFDWYKTKDNNKNKSRMKLTEASSMIQPNDTKFESYQNAQTQSITIMESIDRIPLDDFINESQQTELRKLLDILNNSIYRKFFREIIELESVNLTNFSINKIKSIADKNSNTKSKPSATGFIEFAETRLQIKSNANKIIACITDRELCERVSIGELENKGTIYVRKRYRMLCEHSRREEFSVGIRALRDIKQQLVEIKANWFDSEIITNLLQLKTFCTEHQVKTASIFLGLSKQIVAEDDSEYSPSSGEKSMLLIQKMLKTNSDAYFLDEPELGMGNSYIDSTIRPQLVALAKQRKIVVAATHNANIAVRTLPYVSIFRVHENGEYATYIGNPFNDYLVNIFDNTDMKNWTLESMHTLEGGHAAFYERKDIYESGAN